MFILSTRQITTTSQQQYTFFRVAKDEAFSNGRTSKQTPPYHLTGQSDRENSTWLELMIFFLRGAT